MNIETIEIEQLRAYRDRIKVTLRSEQDVARIRHAAEAAARNIPGMFGLTQRAKDIPVRQLVGFVPEVQQPQIRDERVNEAVEAFISAMDEAVEAIAGFQERVTANSSSRLEDIRQQAIVVIRQIDEQNNGQEIWMSDVQWRLGVSERQVVDAVQFWHDQGALRSSTPPARYQDGTAWFFYMTPQGRTCAAEAERKNAAALSVVNYNVNNYGHANVQQFGAHSNASTSVSALDLPALREALALVREHLSEFAEETREEVREHLDVIDEEMNKPSPRASRVKTALLSIARIAKHIAKPAVNAVLEVGIAEGIKALTQTH